MESGLTWVSGPNTPHRVLLTRIWNFGTWEEWREMRKKVPLSEIEDVVRHPLRGQWTRHGRAFAEVLCDCTMPDDALLCFDA